VKRDDPRHGTYAGYQAHRREGRTPCKQCRAANNDYMASFRKTSAGWREQESARTRAVWRLVGLHYEEFRRLYAEERDRAEQVAP
jgi:hypothetical protein